MGWEGGGMVQEIPGQELEGFLVAAEPLWDTFVPRMSLQSLLILQNNLMGSTNWIAPPNPSPSRCLAAGFVDVGERWGGGEGSPTLPA